MKGISYMEANKSKNDYCDIAQILDRGIDDMDAGREMPVDDAFDLIAELVEKREIAKAEC